MTNVKSRTLVIGSVLFAAIAAGSFAMYSNVASVEQETAAARQKYDIALKQHEETIGVVEKLAQEANSADDWKSVLGSVGSLPTDAKMHFSVLSDVGMFESLSKERDRLLVNAGELFAANENDPGVKSTLAKAHELHKLADAILQKLPEKKDPDWQRALSFWKAYEKYRSLAFLDEKEHTEALNILGEAMVELRACNNVAPKDIKCEYAIEFLYKRTKEEEKKAGDKQQQATGRPRAIPSRMGKEPGPGNEGKGMGPSRDQRY
jgi:hypothetical protein